MMTDEEKEQLVLQNLYIPPRVHKDRIALFFMIWKPETMGRALSNPFEASDGFRLVDMFPSAADAKACAECSRLDFLPGCAIIIDTKTKAVIRADNFYRTQSLRWVDGLSREGVAWPS